MNRPINEHLFDIPVEDGFDHPLTEVLVRELLRDGEEAMSRIRGWIFDESLFKGVVTLKCLGRFSQPMTTARRWRVKNERYVEWCLEIVKDALKHDDIEMRDAAVQAAETWEGEDLIAVLQAHDEPVDYLSKYIEQVIIDLQGEVKRKAFYQALAEKRAERDKLLAPSTEETQKLRKTLEMEAFFRQARFLHDVKQPVLWKIPMWLKKRLAKWCRDRGSSFRNTTLPGVAEAIQGDPISPSQTWLDQWGTIHKGKVFVSEPHLTTSTMRSALKFADELGLALFIEPVSWRRPGHCIRLVLVPNDVSKDPVT